MKEPVIIEGNGCTATLYCGDCRDVLPTLGKVDAVITDPPYGINFDYESHDDTPVGYGTWLWGIISAAEERAVDGAAIFVFQAMLNCRYFSEWFPREYRIYAAAKNFVQMRPTAMQYAFDPVIVWWKSGGEPYKSEDRNIVNRDFFVANTAATVSKPDALQRQHPCPRPLDQMDVIVEQWVKPHGVILDPFMGSGTTGVAALRAGCNFIGIEIDPKYFAIAERRIRAEAAQRKIFQ